ncbi:MAG TPA: hypothetical protein VNN74_01320 [Candidatus Micrarchaeia archaeon]|nr:hypothetical protein [Candidatus Micrarchaeia archaeon]
MVSRNARIPWRRCREALLEPGGLLLAAVLVLSVAAFVQPMFDPDFWWHLRVGLHILAAGVPQHNSYAYTAAGHVFITQEWGTEALFALLYRSAGMLPILLLFGAISWLGLVVGLARAHRPGDPYGVLAGGGALWVLTSLQIWGPRSQTLTFTLAAVLVALLDRHRRRGGRAILWAVPLVALWGNLHGGFVFGLGVFLVVLVGEALANALPGDAPALTAARVPWSRWRLGAAVFVLAALAAMVNPNGPAVYRYPLELLSSHVAQQALQEWQSPDFHQHAMWPLLFLVVSTLLVAGRARRTALSDWLLAAAGLTLALYAVRDIPLFGLLVLPLWVDGAQGLLASVRRPAAAAAARGASRVRPPPARAPRVARALTAAVVLAAIAVVTGARVVASWRSPENNPTGAGYAEPVGRLLCAGPAARVFAPYGASGWLLYRLDRRAPAGRGCAPDRVFIFGEVNVMGPRNLGRYLTAAAGGPAAPGVLARSGTTLVWQLPGSPLAGRLAADPAWRCVFADRHSVLFAPASTAGAWRTTRPERAACPG